MGRYGGALAGIRPDDLGARAIEAAIERSGLDPERISDVFWGAANQSGEDNRDAARMCSLLAGLPVEIPGVTVNRLCASGLEAVNRRFAGAPARRGRPLPRGRRGVDEPRALGRSEAGEGSSPRPRDDARHRARLAAHQPPHGRDALDRVHGRDGGERRRALLDLARRPGRVRPPQPPASRRRDRTRRLRRGNRRNRSAPREEGVRPLNS